MLRYVTTAAAADDVAVSCVGSVILFQFNPVFQLIFKVGLVLISPSGFYQLQNTPVVELLVALCYVCWVYVLPRKNEKKTVVGSRRTAHTHTPTSARWHSCTNTLPRSIVHKY